MTLLRPIYLVFIFSLCCVSLSLVTGCKREPLKDVEWATPSNKVARQLISAPQYRSSRHKIVEHLSHSKPRERWRWLALISAEILSVHEAEPLKFCQMIDDLDLRRIKGLNEGQNGPGVQGLINPFHAMNELCESLSDLDRQIGEHRSKAAELKRLERESKEAIDESEKTLHRIKLNMDDFLILTGFLTSTYGKEVYEISTPRIFEARGWSCETPIYCRSSGRVRPLRIDLGIRVVLALKQYHFNSKGEIRVLVHPGGLVPITLRKGAMTSWYSYVEASPATFREIELNHDKLTQSIAENKRTHRKAKTQARSVMVVGEGEIKKLQREQERLILGFERITLKSHQNKNINSDDSSQATER